ncbi:type II toxin-antitoxin system TacA family antitoxin [Planctobacterium marinum]|uniref:type II toxin-antitoxin system TacA family antitoxin n=1 Tax=Planctobacterium marinum TaxID=1631968 RepID=UPI001E3A086B|nr:DUF1778 domain-containing protein [Planctobacterium marinum]MCC2604421.1 DUF1778 domain-containing protein [Planctobacterium marinum]
MTALAKNEYKTALGNEKPARIELKTTPTVKQQLETAADLKGISLTAFMLSIAQEKALQVIESSHVTRLTRDSWDVLDRAMSKPVEPTDELRALMKRR